METELFAQTYKNYALATVRYPVLEVTATIEPFENRRGFSLRVILENGTNLLMTHPKAALEQRCKIRARITPV